MKLVSVINRETDERLQCVINKAIEQSKINPCFTEKQTRLASSSECYLIVEEGNDIGFCCLVNENRSNLIFLDMVILQEYRGRGSGTLAVKGLKKNRKDFLLAEVKRENIACIKMLEKVGGIPVGECHYLLQPERLNEFNEALKKGEIEFQTQASDRYDILENSYLNNIDSCKIKVR